jgi:hypothetical protein
MRSESMDDLRGDERQSNYHAHDANDPPTGATVRSASGSGSPNLLRHTGRTEGVGMEATALIGPHHWRCRIAHRRTAIHRVPIVALGALHQTMLRPRCDCITSLRPGPQVRRHWTPHKDISSGARRRIG